ncbi:MAG: acyl-CoA dehydrogenase [Planctomycetes bacterium]|nr:acyl-CoA dehydrogenase [Planctomycetota bacterium]
MARYKGVDLYDVDGLLSEEERMVRDSVRDWVEDRFLPIVTEHHRAGTFPAHLVPELGELGLLGATLEGYGAAGLNNVAYGLVLQELERGDSGLRSFVSVQGALCMYPIARYGTEEQKERFLPSMVKGEVIGCFGLTEPDYGSNPGGMTTRAVEDGDAWVLNGTKRWITNGSTSHVAVVWAKLDDEVRGFLVEAGTPGYTTMDIENKFSLRVSVTSELIFEDCRIPKENILPKAEGLKGPLSCLTQARYGIAWGGVGAAQAIYDEVLEYAKTRVQFSRPIAGYQLVQNKLVWMLTEITKAQLVCVQLGRQKDAGTMHHAQVSLAKRNNIWMALKSARMGRDILGASGITDEYHCGRHMCNLESVSTYEGTHDIHTLILGDHITGIPAYE